MQTARETQARRADNFEVLQIALSPAAIAYRDVDQRGRGFLPRAAELRRHAYLPAGAAHQGGLDEVVREYMPAKRLAASQRRQAAALGEGGDANDRVVTPIIAGIAGPRRQSARDHGAIRAGGKLL